MSVAFDEVCVALGLPETSLAVRELIAIRIIELAQRGERDAARLRDRVLREAESHPADMISKPGKRPPGGRGQQAN
jgi:hypothetical protein